MVILFSIYLQKYLLTFILGGENILTLLKYTVLPWLGPQSSRSHHDYISIQPLYKWAWNLGTDWKNIHCLIWENQNLTRVKYAPFVYLIATITSHCINNFSQGLLDLLYFSLAPQALSAVFSQTIKACRKHVTRKICPETASIIKTQDL